MVLPLFLLYLTIYETDALHCGRCLNGGQSYLPNNIFGACKCRCKSPYRGPACQFSKRSGPEKFITEELPLPEDNKSSSDSGGLFPYHDISKQYGTIYTDNELSDVLARILKDMKEHMRMENIDENNVDTVEADGNMKQRAKLIRYWMYNHS